MSSASERPYRGQPPLERTADRRARLVVAGRELFAARGFEAITLADICGRAHVARRHFYDNWSDRRDMLEDLHAEAVTWLRAGATPSATQDLHTWIEDVVTSTVAQLASDPTRARILTLLSPDVHASQQTLASDLTGDLLDRADPKGTDVADVRRHVHGSLMGARAMLVNWIRSSDPGEPLPHPERIAAQVAGFLHAALAPFAEHV